MKHPVPLPVTVICWFVAVSYALALVAQLAVLVEAALARNPDPNRPAPTLAYLATCPVLP